MKAPELTKKLFTAVTCITLAATTLFAVSCSKQEKNNNTEKPEPTYPLYVGEYASTSEYTETTLYVKNEETDRKIYSMEIVPNDLGDKKVPMIVYVHGGNGDITSLKSVAEGLASEDIAGITFECCGANKFSPKSDGKEIYSSHYTSRISDLESIIAHVKTLDYVDTNQIYIYGQSYGGLVCMMDAPNHNDDIKGMFLESTGLTEDGSIVTRTGNGLIEKYLPPEDVNAFINSFTKDILYFCSQGDSTGAHDNGVYTSGIYEQRTQGNIKFYSFEDGEHSFNTFTKEAKQTVFKEMTAFIQNNGIIPTN